MNNSPTIQDCRRSRNQPYTGGLTDQGRRPDWVAGDAAAADVVVVVAAVVVGADADVGGCVPTC